MIWNLVRIRKQDVKLKASVPLSYEVNGFYLKIGLIDADRSGVHTQIIEKVTNRLISLKNYEALLTDACNFYLKLFLHLSEWLLVLVL